MKKKLVTMLLATALVGILLAGCKGGSDESEEGQESGGEKQNWCMVNPMGYLRRF